MISVLNNLLDEVWTKSTTMTPPSIYEKDGQCVKPPFSVKICLALSVANDNIADLSPKLCSHPLPWQAFWRTAILAVPQASL